MDRSKVKDRVFKVVSENLDVYIEKVDEKKHLRNDLKADSLDVVELVMALEDEFEMEISDKDSERLVTVGQIIDYVFDFYKEEGL